MFQTKVVGCKKTYLLILIDYQIDLTLGDVAKVRTRWIF